jgi:hypothetical protein
MPELLVRRKQVFGPLGNRGFKRFVGGFGSAQRVLQFPA